jgi:hypothetical protein
VRRRPSWLGAGYFEEEGALAARGADRYVLWEGERRLRETLESDRVYRLTIALAIGLAAFAASGFGRIQWAGSEASLLLLGLMTAGVGCALIFRNGLFVGPHLSQGRAWWANTVPLLLAGVTVFALDLLGGGMNWLPLVGIGFGAGMLSILGLDRVGRVVGYLLLPLAFAIVVCYRFDTRNDTENVMLGGIAIAVATGLILCARRTIGPAENEDDAAMKELGLSVPRLTLQPSGLLAALAAVLLIVSAILGVTPDSRLAGVTAGNLSVLVLAGVIVGIVVLLSFGSRMWLNGALVGLLHLSAAPLGTFARTDPWTHVVTLCVEFFLLMVAGWRFERARLTAVVLAPGTYTGSECAVPSLDRGRHHPLESDVVVGSRRDGSGRGWYLALVIACIILSGPLALALAGLVRQQGPAPVVDNDDRPLKLSQVDGKGRPVDWNAGVKDNTVRLRIEGLEPGETVTVRAEGGPTPITVKTEASADGTADVPLKNLPSGDYKWKVSTEGEDDGQAKGQDDDQPLERNRMTGQDDFSVPKTEPRIEALGQMTTDGEKLARGGTAKEEIVFDITATGATSVSVEVVPADSEFDGQNISTRTLGEKDKVQFSAAFPSGSYRWRARATNPDGEYSGWTTFAEASGAGTTPGASDFDVEGPDLGGPEGGDLPPPRFEPKGERPDFGNSLPKKKGERPPPLPPPKRTPKIRLVLEQKGQDGRLFLDAKARKLLSGFVGPLAGRQVIKEAEGGHWLVFDQWGRYECLEGKAAAEKGRYYRLSVSGQPRFLVCVSPTADSGRSVQVRVLEYGASVTYRVEVK